MGWEELESWAASSASSEHVPALHAALRDGGPPALVSLLRDLVASPRVDVRPALLAYSFWSIHGGPVNAGDHEYHASLLAELDGVLPRDVSVFASVYGSDVLESLETVSVLAAPLLAGRTDEPAQVLSDVLAASALLPAAALSPGQVEDSLVLAWISRTCASFEDVVSKCVLSPLRFERSTSLLGGRRRLPVAGVTFSRSVELAVSEAAEDDEVLIVLTSGPDVCTHVPPAPLRDHPAAEWRYRELRRGGLSPSASALAAEES